VNSKQLQRFMKRIAARHDPSVVAFRLKVAGKVVETAIPRKIGLSSEQIAMGMTEEVPQYRVTIPGDVNTDKILSDSLTGSPLMEVSFDAGETYQSAQVADTITNNGMYWQFVLKL